MQNEERINGLETQVRTLKRIVYGFGCLLVAGVVVSATSLQSVLPIVKAKQFQVVNESGVVTALITNDKSNNGGLWLYDSKGTPSIKITGGFGMGTGLTVLNEQQNKVVNIFDGTMLGGWIMLNDEDGEATHSMFSGPSIENPNAGNIGNICTFQGKGKPLVQLGGTGEGGRIKVLNLKTNATVQLNASPFLGSVITQNGKGQTLVELVASTNGEGMVITQNGKGQTLVKLGTTTSGVGLVKTENGKGQALVELGASTDGEGIIQTNSSNGKPLVILSATSNGGAVQTQNGRGKVTSTTP